MESKMFLEAVGHYGVPVWGMLFTPLTEVYFARALQVHSLEGSGRKCELRDVAGNGRFSLQHHHEWRGICGGVERGLWEKVPPNCCLLLLWGLLCCGSGGMAGLLWDRAQWGGIPLALHIKGGSSRGRGSQLPSFAYPSSHEVHKLAHRGAHHGQLHLLESLLLKMGCIMFQCSCLPQ